jgi:hypothetical protein
MPRLPLASVLTMVFATALISSAQIQSSTTLSALHSNNTAAPDTFNGTLRTTGGTQKQNGLPSVQGVSVSSENIHSLITYAGSSDGSSGSAINPRVFVHVLEWFCDTGTNSCDGHVIIGAGYNDHNTQHIHEKVDDMRRRGIDGVVLYWNGQGGFLDTTAKLYRDYADQICSQAGNPTPCPLQVGLMDANTPSSGYNSCTATSTPTCTSVYVSNLNYIYNNYYVAHPSGWRAADGRPIMSNFLLEGKPIDFASAYSQVTFNPYLIFQFPGAGSGTTGFNGLYEWQHPQYKNGSGDPNNENLSASPNGDSIDEFYTKFSGNVEIGGAYAGFDDVAASWGQGRKLNRKCGKTFLDTMRELNQFFSASKQLPYLQLVTWDDYEEGTALEPGISNCLNSITGATSGNTLTLTLQFGAQPIDLNPQAGDIGNDSTVARYDIYYTTQDPSAVTDDTQVTLTYAGSENNASTRSIDLSASNFRFPSGQLWLFVNAVGKPFIQNHVNDRAHAIPYTATGAFNIDDQSWICSGNCTAAVADTTVQLDGSSIKFPYTGGAAFSSGQWTSVLAGNLTSATNFTLDFWGYMPAPGVAQALEVKADQVVGGREYPFAFQCDLKGSQTWRVWNQGTQTWVGSTAPCTAPPANTWVHYVMHFSQGASQQVHYQDVTVNGTTSVLNKDMSSLANSGAAGMSVRFKLDGDGTGTAYSLNVDKMSVTY